MKQFKEAIMIFWNKTNSNLIDYKWIIIYFLIVAYIWET